MKNGDKVRVLKECRWGTRTKDGFRGEVVTISESIPAWEVYLVRDAEGNEWAFRKDELEKI